jgi:hypothetical protein
LTLLGRTVTPEALTGLCGCEGDITPTTQEGLWLREPDRAAVKAGRSPTSKTRPHGEVMVVHSEKRLRFSCSDFGHIEVLFM